MEVHQYTSLEDRTMDTAPFAATGGTRMRKITLTMSISLDGFFETADRDIGWHLEDDGRILAQRRPGPGHPGGTR
jgi:hypothetical protein